MKRATEEWPLTFGVYFKHHRRKNPNDLSMVYEVVKGSPV